MLDPTDLGWAHKSVAGFNIFFFKYQHPYYTYFVYFIHRGDLKKVLNIE